MPNVDIDFDGSANQTSTDTATNANGNPANQADADDLHGGTTADVTNTDNNTQTDNTDSVDNNADGNSDNNNNAEDATETQSDLEPGTQIEFDGTMYIVSDNGDLVDDKGNIFKEAKDVDAWLKEVQEDSTVSEGDLDLNSIKDAIGIDVTDENGKPVEFTNDAEGVKKYVDSVISIKSAELQQGAINKLYADNPLLKQFVDYVTLTGTPRGFGEIPDRTGIELDKDNANQLEAVIRMAATEFGNKSVNDNYIKYLKDNGALYEEAKVQLEALIEKDNNVRREITERAELARREEEQRVNEYWQGVSNAIVNGNIGGYKLPNTFVKEVNGRKITYTKDDFYDYLAKPAVADENGNRLTAYQRDLQALSDEDTLNRELLDAWLMFTGGSYKDLVDMAVREDKVRKLVIKSKERRNTHTVKINKANKGKVNPDDILF